MTALLIDHRVIFEVDFAVLVFGAMGVTTVLVVSMTAISIGMLRLGEKGSSQSVRDRLKILEGQLKEQAQTIASQEKQLLEQAESIGIYKGAVEHMRNV